MVATNEMIAPVMMMGVMCLLLLFGAFLRVKIPFLRKMMFSASIIAGVLGFILMSTHVLPLSTNAFESLSLHLLSLNLMSICYLNIGRKKERGKKGDPSKRGGLTMGLATGSVICLQALLGGILAIVVRACGFADFKDCYGYIIANGFGASPSAALAAGKLWQTGGLGEDVIQIGLFYGAVGFLVASLVGVPLLKHMIKKHMVTNADTAMDKAAINGFFSAEDDNVPGYGKQTLHRSNLDTLVFYLAFLFGTYSIIYCGMSWLFNKLPSGGDMLYSCMFIFAVLGALVFMALVKLFKLDRFFNYEIQVSVSNVTTDLLLVACMMAVSITVVARYLLPLLINCVLITVVTIVVCWFYARKTGKYWAERFLFLYGNATGTMVSGQVLLRAVDPSFKTIGNEIVAFQSFGLLTSFTTNMAMFVPMMTTAIYLGINAGVAVLAGVLCLLLAKNLRKAQKKVDEQREAVTENTAA